MKQRALIPVWIAIAICTALNIVMILGLARFQKARKKEPYSFKNLITTLSQAKPLITCDKPIYVHIQSPPDQPPNTSNPEGTARYALAPCSILFMGEKPVTATQGYVIVNRLHSDFERLHGSRASLGNFGEFAVLSYD